MTPFDRWLGIDVRSEDSKTSADFAVPTDFVDSMDEANYARGRVRSLSSTRAAEVSSTALVHRLQ